MTDIAPLSPGQIAAMRERHVADEDGFCVECSCVPEDRDDGAVTVWPCDAARLLATVDAVTTLREDVIAEVARRVNARLDAEDAEFEHRLMYGGGGRRNALRGEPGGR